jgi:PAS domain S-box-containing protein
VGGERSMSGSLADEIRQSEMTADRRVITEARPPYRIVHVNQAWCASTGYRQDEVANSTCKILQGPETCPRTTQVLHASLQSHRPITVRLVNYRADRSPFINDLTVMPIQDGNLTTHFLGIMRERPFPGVCCGVLRYAAVCTPSAHANPVKCVWLPCTESERAAATRRFFTPLHAYCRHDSKASENDVGRSRPRGRTSRAVADTGGN